MTVSYAHSGAPIWSMPENERDDTYSIAGIQIVPFELEPGKTTILSADHLIGFSSSGVRLRSSFDGGKERDFELPAGSFLFNPAGVLFEAWASPACRGIVLMVGDEVLRGAACETIDPAMLELEPKEVVTDPAAFHAAALLERLAAEDPRSLAQMQDGLITTICARVIRELVPRPANDQAAPGLTPARMRRVLDYIRENFERHITLRELAGVAALSTFHFARSFRRCLGVTPGRYLWRFRAEAAARMLQGSPDRSISDVAHSCGFSSQSHFTEVFKREMGATPARFRLDRIGRGIIGALVGMALALAVAEWCLDPVGPCIAGAYECQPDVED